MNDFEQQLAALVPRDPGPGLRARIRGDLAPGRAAPSFLRWFLPAAALGCLVLIGASGALFTAGPLPAPRISLAHIEGESGLLYRDGKPTLKVTRVTSIVCVAWQDPRTHQEIVRFEPQYEITLSPIEIQ